MVTIDPLLRKKYIHISLTHKILLLSNMSHFSLLRPNTGDENLKGGKIKRMTCKTMLYGCPLPFSILCRIKIQQLEAVSSTEQVISKDKP